MRWRRRVELYGLPVAVGVGAAVVVYASRHAGDPPVAVAYVLATLASFSVVAWVLRDADHLLLALTALLVGVGTATVYRVQPHLVAYHAAWTCGGLALLLVAYRSATWPELHVSAAAGALLSAVSVLPWAWAYLARGLGGAAGVDAVGEVSAEAAKLLVVVLAASEVPRGQVRGPAVLAWAAAVGLALARGDLSTAAVLVWVGAAVTYFGTGEVRLPAAAAAGFAALGVLFSRGFPHLVDRWRGWWDPWADPFGAGYPVVQALFALAAGGITGSGPGWGYPELVPDAHTFGVLAAVGEEWGFAGVVAVLAAYALWLGRAFRTALAAGPSPAGVLAAGVASLVGAEAFLAGAAGVGLVPRGEVLLPFVSFGGVSLALHLAMAGLLLGASRGRRRWKHG